MFGVVVIARRKRIETSGQAIDGGFEVEIIVVGKDDVKITI